MLTASIWRNQAIELGIAHDGVPAHMLQGSDNVVQHFFRIVPAVVLAEILLWQKGLDKRAVKAGTSGASLPEMAWANLGRSKSKTVVTIISLTLAVVLMNLVYTF